MEEERVISGPEQEADTWQLSLRPRRLVEYIGQDQVKQNLSVFIQAALLVAKRWTMCCFMDLPVLEKRRWPELSPMNLASVCGLHPDRPLSEPGIWRLFLRTSAKKMSCSLTRSTA